MRNLRTADIEGSGLGLYICDRIVRAHGGRLGVESVAGEGSVFSFTLPLFGAGAQTRPPLVLVAAGDERTRREVRRVAEELGYAIHEVADGVEAVEAALRLLPAAVVLDRILPQLGAREVAERLRENTATEAVPLFALAAAATWTSGRPLPRLRAEATRPGVARRRPGRTLAGRCVVLCGPAKPGPPHCGLTGDFVAFARQTPRGEPPTIVPGSSQARGDGMRLRDVLAVPWSHCWAGAVGRRDQPHAVTLAVAQCRRQPQHDAAGAHEPGRAGAGRRHRHLGRRQLGLHRDGRRFALTGLSTGTSIVEVTSPSSPRRVAFIEGPASQWREIKTYKTYVYVTTEARATGWTSST